MGQPNNGTAAITPFPTARLFFGWVNLIMPGDNAESDMSRAIRQNRRSLGSGRALLLDDAVPLVGSSLNVCILIYRRGGLDDAFP